jgi:hypothetical protein
MARAIDMTAVLLRFPKMIEYEAVVVCVPVRNPDRFRANVVLERNGKQFHALVEIDLDSADVERLTPGSRVLVREYDSALGIHKVIVAKILWSPPDEPKTFADHMARVRALKLSVMDREALAAVLERLGELETENNLLKGRIRDEVL